MTSIYLASKSPRRQALLSQLGVKFELIEGEIDETPFINEDAKAYVLRLATAKAQAGWQNSQKDKAVLGSDTIVVFNGELLGKPTGLQDAIRMLSMLSGQTHQVMTAVCLYRENTILTDVVISQVTFAKLTKQEIVEYWQTGEPLDKAGSYAIQGIGGQFVVNINGNYSAIVGLPLYQTKQLLAQLD
ncbi:Maf-like protein [Catenovulum sp. 2E275]|uniref:Maf family protein n=1 Tax=Catenovulum sp. 2E275 TaxID=2980497 RepID=UPI0021D27593|nr:Maf family protein [Catenovulum sp. 2E275]MCU4676581.1 Maf-like protein [Catenovulum sp. 2E275]